MKLLQKNYSLQNKNSRYISIRKSVFIVNILLLSLSAKAQIANYVSNGGFEESYLSTSVSPFDAAKFWRPIDTNQIAYYLYSTIYGNAPYCSTGFQLPRSGNSFVLSQFFTQYGQAQREYPRNRLKQHLIVNQIYCAKYHIVNTNNNRIAIDSYGIYVGNSTMDTITKCMIPLTYLTPQIENTAGNIIKDTLNWIPITGTFVATGAEKYLVLGNFRSNAATNTLLINTPTLTNMSNDIYLDDVSLIEMELPAFAGRDTTCIPGTSVYLGRQRDVEIDESCRWYKLPIIITPTTPAIDTAAGIWVSPTQTSTYVVRQQLWCSGVKWDTVVVFKDGVGINALSGSLSEVRLYPNPASNILYFETQSNEGTEGHRVQLFNALGQLVREEELNFKEKQASIDVADLQVGIYTIKLQNANAEVIYKRIVINR